MSLRSASDAANYGEDAPLARIYELDGSDLLLGVGYDRNTSFHLAEHRVPGTCKIAMGATIVEGNDRIWKMYEDIALDTDVFPELGEAFERAEPVTRCRVGSAESPLFSQESAVDFAASWISMRRASKSE